MPDWEYTETLPCPLSDHVRKYAMFRLLSVYGGMVVPPSFVCGRDLIELYNASLDGSSNIFVCENVNNSVSSESKEYTPDTVIMGCKAKTPLMKEFTTKVKSLISRDCTNEMDALGKIGDMCSELVNKNAATLINAELIGVKDKKGNRVYTEDLLGNTYIDFTSHAYGILINMNEILNRRTQIFARLSGEQVLESNTIIGKYILVANIPSKKNMLEPDDSEKPEWISLKVPSNMRLFGV